jgi:hypothetical protein
MAGERGDGATGVQLRQIDIATVLVWLSLVATLPIAAGLPVPGLTE